MDFIQIDFYGAVSNARWCDERNQYVTDTVVIASSGDNPSEAKLHPARTWHLSYAEMIRDSRYKVTNITKDDYWKDANQRLAKHFEDEIEQMQNELNEKMNKLIAFKSSVGLA